MDNVCSKEGISPIYYFLNLSPSNFEVLHNVLILFLISGAIGIFTRMSLATAAILSFIYFSSTFYCLIPISKFIVPWGATLVPLNLFILSLNRDIGRIGVASLFTKYSYKDLLNTQTNAWTENLIKFHLIFSYFSGGLFKIKSGTLWMNGFTLQYHFLTRHLRINTPMAYEFAQFYYLCVIASVSIVVLELISPLALFKEKFALPIVLLLLGFQFMCYTIMDLRWMEYYGWTYLIYFNKVPGSFCKQLANSFTKRTGY